MRDFDPFLGQLSTGVLRACTVLIMYFVTCIYIYARGCTFNDDGVSFVRAWMRFMIYVMLILHMDASSSRLLGTWMPLFDRI